MISMYKFEQIRELIKSGANDSEIGRKLNIHRKTVARYRQANAPPKYSERKSTTKPDPASDFKEELAKLMNCKEPPTARSIFYRFRRMGYQGSRRTIERRVAEIKNAKPKERFYSQEYDPAEQCQLDFKETVPIQFLSGSVIVHFFVGSMPFSGCYFAKAFPNKTFEAFMDGLHSLFEYLGGMTTNIRFDNLSPVVKKVLTGRKRLYTESFERAHRYYDFGLLPCNAGKGSDKGDVERDIRTFSGRLQDELKLEKTVFKDFDEFNQWLREFCERDMTAKTVELLNQEKDHLVPLPPRDENILGKVSILPVSKFGTVRVAKSTYSVPDEFIGCNLKAVVSAYFVEFFTTTGKKRFAAKHQRMQAGSNSILLEHSLRSLLRKPQAMVRWAHRDILFPSDIFKKYYAMLKRQDPLTAERRFLQSINLVQQVVMDDIEMGMDLVNKTRPENPYEELRELVLSEGHRPSVGTIDQPPIVVDLNSYDELIPPSKKGEEAS